MMTSLSTPNLFPVGSESTGLPANEPIGSTSLTSSIAGFLRYLPVFKRARGLAGVYSNTQSDNIRWSAQLRFSAAFCCGASAARAPQHLNSELDSLTNNKFRYRLTMY
jgi:hypothetical protein